MSHRPFPKSNRPDLADLDLGSTDDDLPREVELYVGFPIDEELRDGLQLFLNAHSDLDEEATLAKMLALGLRHMIEGDGGQHHHDASLRRTIREIEASQRRVLLSLACRAGAMR